MTISMKVCRNKASNTDRRTNHVSNSLSQPSTFKRNYNLVPMDGTSCITCCCPMLSYVVIRAFLRR